MAETYRVPEENLADLTAKIEKLARRAEKLGLPAPRIMEEGHEDSPMKVNPNYSSALGTAYYVPAKPGDEIDHYHRTYLVRLEGEAPTIPGWRLVCVVEHTTDSEIGNLLRTVPGMECPASYRTAVPLCEHCGTQRRRNETFVLLSSEGAYKQVGRNCLADFCRSPEAAENLIACAELLSSAIGFCGMAEEECCGGSGRVRRFSLSEVLWAAARLVRGMGWTSRTAAREDPDSKVATADIVFEIKTNPKWEQMAAPALMNAMKNESEDDSKTVEEALSWIREMRSQAEALPDYLYNLLVVCSQETIEAKHFGLACSLIASWLREKEKVASATRQAATSNHFGTLKKREIFSLTCTGVRAFEGGYGTKFLYRFVDAAGNVAIWWGSNAGVCREGENYRLKGTVKAHGEYKGIKQTELTRCTVQE